LEFAQDSQANRCDYLRSIGTAIPGFGPIQG
jgi:hypothetical protein